MDEPRRPSSASAAALQFENSGQGRAWGIVGFGVVLVLSISAVGILITHKVAGPLYKIASIFGRVRDNRLGPAPANLRKGDRLQEFYGAFKEMHVSLRARAEDDVRVLGNVVAVLETAPDARSPALARALETPRAPQAQGREPPRSRSTTRAASPSPWRKAGDESWRGDRPRASALTGLRGRNQAEAVQEETR